MRQYIVAKIFFDVIFYEFGLMILVVETLTDRSWQCLRKKADVSNLESIVINLVFINMWLPHADLHHIEQL